MTTNLVSVRLVEVSNVSREPPDVVMEEAVLDLVVKTVAQIQLVPVRPEELEADLYPVAPVGPHVALVRGGDLTLLSGDVVEVEAIEKLGPGIPTGVLDHVPGQHVLHDGDGSPLPRHALHVLHQPENGLGRHEGGGGQRRRLGDEGQTGSRSEHRILDVLQTAGSSQKLEVLLVLKSTNYSEADYVDQDSEALNIRIG